MKEQMDGSTMLFKGDSYCRAYNLEYLNKNFRTISHTLQNTVRNVYYKANPSRSSWIDYEDALLNEDNLELEYIERIIRGLEGFIDEEDPSKRKGSRLRPQLKELPETEFTDYLGYVHIIGPRDGLDSSSVDKERLNIIKDNIDKKISQDADGRYLEVNFKTDVYHALFTLNGVFEKITRTPDRHIIRYYEKDLPEKLADYLFDEYLDYFQVEAFLWRDLELDKDRGKIYPVKMEDDWIIFEEPIDSGYLLFYNKIMYFYDRNEFDDRYVRIINEDRGDVSNFDLDKIFMIRLIDSKKEPIRQERFSGFLDTSKHIAHFPRNIRNSFITYNGAYHGYTILPGAHSIKFHAPNDDLLYTTHNSVITAVNFFSGPKNCSSGIYMTSDLSKTINMLTSKMSAQLNSAEKRILELKKNQDLLYDDFEDKLYYNPDKPTILKLAYAPERHSLRLFINGVRYEEDIYYTFDQHNKEIKWTYTADNNGFDLDKNSKIIAVYDINYEQNGIENIEKFIEENK